MDPSLRGVEYRPACRKVHRSLLGRSGHLAFTFPSASPGPSYPHPAVENDEHGIAVELRERKGDRRVVSRVGESKEKDEVYRCCDGCGTGSVLEIGGKRILGELTCERSGLDNEMDQPCHQCVSLGNLSVFPNKLRRSSVLIIISTGESQTFEQDRLL